MSALTQSPAWLDLQAHAAKFPSEITALFAADSQRAQDFSCEAAGLYLDYSKQRASQETRVLLRKLAAQQGLDQWIEKLFAGVEVNATEHRAAFHVALRTPRESVMRLHGENVVPAVHEVLDRVCAFAQRVRSGEWKGCTGLPIKDVVNIGIGGSDLGPRMVCEALADFADGPRLHFVSNVDGAQISTLLHKLDPLQTLWIITSKTFTTQETMANAQAARRWFLKSASSVAIAQHFVAVSTNHAEVQKFGIEASNMFGFWDWVGGRYSLWSAVGLSIVLAVGATRFRELLAGAHAMDRHFREAPLAQNMPVLMGLLGVWNNNFLHCASHNIAAYSQRLCSFSAWLQQLEMESNGKSVNRDGMRVDYATTPVLWGDVGTNGQHAFFQMLHQGTAVHSVDFLLPIETGHELADQHRMLAANCLAQSAALMQGQTDAASPHRVFEGNRPSNTLLIPRLDAFHLGAVLALYEHRAFVQSVIWEINAFDQWGVELGKQLAQSVLKSISGETVTLDASTLELLRRLKR